MTQTRVRIGRLIWYCEAHSAWVGQTAEEAITHAATHRGTEFSSASVGFYTVDLGEVGI